MGKPSQKPVSASFILGHVDSSTGGSASVGIVFSNHGPPVVMLQSEGFLSVEETERVIELAREAIRRIRNSDPLGDIPLPGTALRPSPEQDILLLPDLPDEFT
jgi:hypothetical protein